MLNILRRTSPKIRTVQALHSNLVAAARQPVFFREYGVADTIDGRFDVVALHGWLVLGRLRSAGQSEIAQALSDAIFVAFDEGLRDLGNGDMGMGPRMKKLGNAFNGRLLAYEAAVGREAELREAILRNVYRAAPGMEPEAGALARYVVAARARLESCDLLAGTLDFGSVPTTFG
ncbi:MAG TPA: ubiquinol-cytochrome C chaperone family protein [Rhizomicrobium sp.]|nr:ubiquinol-cytochrome C chaperone family protein [Rhizomicrobium sp.]